MPTVSKKQRRLMRRIASNKKMAKERNISQEVARNFLKADQLEAKTLVHQNLSAWLEEKDEQLWVTGTEHANIKSLAKKIASFWKATPVDLDELVAQRIDQDKTLTGTINNTIEALEKHDGPIVVYGYQVPFFHTRAHAFVGMELKRVPSSEFKHLRVDELPELALTRLSKKKVQKLITKMVKTGERDEELIKELLQYDPDDTAETVSTEAMPASYSW